MSEVVIDIKRTGFPVKIGVLEMWFDTSNEALTRFYDVEEEAQKRLNEFKKLIIKANIDKDIESDNVTKETVLEAIEIEKKLLEIQYDLIFGDGTFEKLYAVYPDYQALEKAFAEVSKLIEEKLNELAKEREKAAKERAKTYTRKTKTVSQKKK